MAESLSTKHRVEEDRSGLKAVRLIGLAVLFVVLLMVSLSVSIITRGKSIEMQLIGNILCMILIAATIVVGIILLIYAPRELRKFNEKLEGLVKEVRLDVNYCSFEESQKKLVTAEAYGGKTYDMEILNQDTSKKKEPSEYYIAYIETKKKNEAELYVSIDPINEEDALRIFNTEDKNMKIDLYAADRNTAYKLIENAGSDGNAIEDTDLKENPLKIAHFRHALYVADEKYPVQVFYGASDQ